MLEKIKDKATILYIRLLFGKFKNKVDYSFKDYKCQIYLFTNKERRGAQCTPFDTIIAQDIFFEKHSKNVRDYIFLHELGHTKLNFFLKLIFFLLAVPALYLFFSIIPFVVLVPLLFIYKRISWVFALSAFLSYFLLFTLISLAILILSWAVEGHADIFAIKNMEEINYLSAIKELTKKSKRKNIFKKYFYHIRYPPERLVLWFYRKYIITHHSNPQ